MRILSSIICFMLTLSLIGQNQFPLLKKEKAVKAAPPITFETLLQELTDRTVVARMPSKPYRLLQYGKSQ